MVVPHRWQTCRISAFLGVLPGLPYRAFSTYRVVVRLRPPIPALALLGLQLGACGHDDPIVSTWTLHERDGEAKPADLEITMEVGADLSGDFNYSYSLYGEGYSYSRGIEIDADDAPTYVISLLPSNDLPAEQMRCTLEGDILSCTDVGGADLGDPVFKRR